MLVLCHDPKQPPTTAGDWPSILIYLLERARLSVTETERERERWPKGYVLSNQSDADEALNLHPL